MKNNGSGRALTNWMILCSMLFGLYFVGSLYFAISKKAEEVHVFSPDVVAQEIRLNNIQELTFTQESLKITGRLNPEKARERGPMFTSEAVSLAHIDEIRKLAEEKNVKLNVLTPPPMWILSLVTSLFWIAPLIVIWWFFIIKPAQGQGNRVMQFGTTKAKLQNKSPKKVTFNDVAGCDEAKEELREVVEFLKNPGKYTRIGGKIPKGVLLYGPPGNGKTLLAKAVAGEAGVPFFSVSAAEFVEMFVGVGASRVRDLFDKAKKAAPCIIFVDELDAIGRSRFSGIGGGHDEREQTLNQILTELDGFETNDGVILIGATNRPEVLDSALLRPGRFDRKIQVDTSNLDGRLEILKVHSKEYVLDPSVDLLVIAKQTPGFSGADLANILNEAALIAVRKNKSAVGTKEIEEGIYRAIAGPQNKKHFLTEKEKAIIAYHESGHTLAAKYTEGADPVHKVSIVSRGRALGHTLQLPDVEKYLSSKKDMLNRLRVLVGGRVAEEIHLGKESVTAGASDDFNRATELVRRMVMEFGMGSWLSVISTEGRAVNHLMTNRSLPPCSEKRQQEIDEEVEKILLTVMDEVRALLESKRAVLDKLSTVLLEKEELDGKEIDAVINSA